MKHLIQINTKFLQYLKRAHECFVHAHHTARIVELSAVIWRRKKSHQLTLGKKLVTIFYHLMSPTN